MSELGKIPSIGDVVQFEDVKLVVLEVEKMRVSKVEIQRED
ncbi:MAG: transporter associated domain-containing protein [Cetobacterium sp.]